LLQARLTNDDENAECPLELQKLEEKLAIKYRKELEVQKEKHDEEIQKLRQQLDARTQRQVGQLSSLRDAPLLLSLILIFRFRE